MNWIGLSCRDNILIWALPPYCNRTFSSIFGISGLDSVESVVGYSDSDMYIQDHVSPLYTSTATNTQFLMYHRVFNEPAVISALEFSPNQRGEFKFAVSQQFDRNSYMFQNYPYCYFLAELN